MVIALVLIVLVIGSIVFHFWSPWWLTPLSSNWGLMDDTLTITFIVTGFVFVAINLFMALAIFRFRHRKGHKAVFEPENKKLEIWLVGLTTVGVVIMLAPGLIVYADFVHVPKNAMVFEVIAKQWQWGFRFPGKDGVLGNTQTRFVSFKNPFGINPADPNAQDDILIANGALHLPKDQPVQVLLRSLDVLHDFYVPHFRVKMDAVPGIVSSLWFKPTKVGKYDLACAEYCGMGHHTMHNVVIVDQPQDFQLWLGSQPTFSQLQQASASPSTDPLVEKGQQLAQELGCLGCHSIDGSPAAGPSWKGLFERKESLSTGSAVIADAAYIEESISNPKAKLVKGYADIMPAYTLDRKDLDALLAFTRSLSAEPVSVSLLDAAVQQGQHLAQFNGCLNCHSIDGTQSIGPSWKDLYGRKESLESGDSISVDEDYLVQSIRNPTGAIVQGYGATMPAYEFTEAEIQAIIAYTKSLSKFAAVEKGG